MKPYTNQLIFSNYEEYLDYQVKKCVTPIDHPYYKDVFDAHLKIINEYLDDLKRDVSILDCGCGYGFALRAFMQCGYTNVVGTDISEERLSSAVQVGYPVLRLDMHEMQAFEDAAFDVVYSSHSIEHGLYPDRALSEISRIIKPGGILMLTLPYPVVVDDDHIRKAHCGAIYLNLTSHDGGLGLIMKVEGFGFSLRARGTGSYRDEAEIYLKFVKGTPGSLVREYGPHCTSVNTRFNVQPNGSSALWFVIDDPYETDLVVEFDGYTLKSARTENTLSALVPDILLESPRVLNICVFDVSRQQRRAQLQFEVKGMATRDSQIFLPIASQMPKKPNFFIVGAPRSGTTSMYWHLTRHPDIYLTRIKEPFFFDDRAHGVLSGAIIDEKEYLALYRYVPFHARVIGEASTTYLSSRDALKKIHAFNPKAKILVMLRNPISATVSMYLQMRRSGKYEQLSSFEDAWRNSHTKDRPFVTQYAELFQIGYQLQAAEAIWGKNNIKVVIFDDLVNDSEAVSQDVLNFLELPPDLKTPFPRTNSANWNDIHAIVPKELLEELTNHFQRQVQIVSDYTERNLDHWLIT
jgi:SAM-dependent methyltransferase